MQKITKLLLPTLLLLLFAGTSLLFAKDEPLWRLTFDQAGPDNNLKVKEGSLQGPLPLHVGHNYLGWQNSTMKSTMLTEEGQTFFRFTVGEVDAGGPQMTVRIPELQQGKYYRLTATVRNDSDGVFSMYLREGPAPYKSIGTAVSLESSSLWQTESTIIRFEKPGSGSYSLYFNLAGSGTFDIREFTIDESDYNAWNAQRQGLSPKNSFALRRPDSQWSNYLPGSCFPFGVPAGWNCRRGVALLDDDCSGPSGQKTLLVKPGFGEIESPCLYSPPFQVPDPNKKYTISFSCKGEEKVTCNGKSFSLNEKWQRFDMPLTVSPNVAGVVLEFTSNSSFQLDAVRIAPEGENDYRPAGTSEILLGMPQSETSDGRVQFDDEPAALCYQILGESSNITLSVKVTNIWGVTKETSITPKQANGTLNYMLFPETPRGQFRVNVQAKRGERELSPIAEFVVTRLARPVYWGKDAPDSPLGIHVEPISHMLSSLKAGGINWVRLHDAGANYSLWYHLEPEKGKWRFFDAEIQNYRKYGMMIYGQLGGAPVWASYYGKSGPVTTSKYWIRYCAPTDDHLVDFENYAYQIVKHYKGTIHDWCLWNEPWGSFLHKGYDPVKDQYITFDNQGEAYTKILKAAYAGAKRADPTVQISGFGTYPGADKFTGQIVDAGGFEHCDELDYHLYSPRSFGYPDDGILTGYNRTFASVVKKYGPVRKNIIMSEGSPLSNGSDRGKPLQGIYKYILPWENMDRVHDKSDRIIRYVMALQSCGVKRVFLYTSHGHKNLTQSSFQLLLAADGYPHPSLAALSAYAQQVEDARFVEYRKLTDGVWLALFQKKDGSTFAVVTGKKRTEIKIESGTAGAKGFDLYGNPLSFPLTYDGYLKYIVAPCSPDQLKASAK